MCWNRLPVLFVWAFSALFAASPALGWGNPVDEAVRDFAKDVAPAIPPDAKLLVADLGDLDERVSHFGRYLADKVQVELASRKRPFQLVDRRRLDLTTEELRLQSSGLLDEAGAARVGRLLGATAVFYGTVTEVDGAYDVTVKLRGIEKGEILWGGSRKIKKTKKVAALVAQAAESEREKELELEQAREQVAREVAQAKEIMLAAIKEEERVKRAELAGLEETIRAKSRDLREFEARRRELARIDRRIGEIGQKLDEAARMPMRMRVGMTRKEVLELLLDQPMSREADCLQVRQYFLTFQGGSLEKVVRMGAWDVGQRPVRNCLDAKEFGPNVALQ